MFQLIINIWHNCTLQSSINSYLLLSGGTTTGNLGIGTAMPFTKLDVNGVVNTTTNAGLNTTQ